MDCERIFMNPPGKCNPCDIYADRIEAIAAMLDGPQEVPIAKLDAEGVETTVYGLGLVTESQRTAPVISGLTPVSVDEGGSFDPMEGVTATDEDGAPSDVTVSGDYNLDAPGTYTLTYTATDGIGVSSTGTRQLTVTPWNINNYKTTLFTDGTLIINEELALRPSDTALHGAVLNEYTAWNKRDPDNSYQFSAGGAPWYAQRANVKKVEIGSTFKPTSTAYFFYLCTALTDVNAETWDVSQVVTFEGMFASCSALTEVNVSGWNTSSAISMRQIFADCSALTSVDVSNWDVSKVTTFMGMFYNCAVLTSVDVSGWDTSSATDMERMFSNCYAMTRIDVTGLDTENVTNMRYMFFRCTSATVIDLSGWHTPRLRDTRNMFEMSSALKTIYASDTFDVSNVTQSTLMFDSNYVLVGGNGTAYSAAYRDKTYARLDNPPDAPGYFTREG